MPKLVRAVREFGEISARFQAATPGDLDRVPTPRARFTVTAGHRFHAGGAPNQ